ncbi:MAG: fasciclin [Alphaproteobacteria bacterium]|nr:MAG: fasciclin [Alphaproteobacteria bacterium]
MKKLITTAAVAAFSLALASCGAAEAPPAAPEAPAAEQPAATGTIVDAAVASPDFTTLVAAVQAAGLAETLSSAGPFTVFAPTNAAFAKLPAGTVENLTQPAQRETLSGILTYHVVSGRVSAADLISQIQAGGGTATVTTVQGGTLTARLSGSSVVLTDAAGGTSTVTATDLNQSNGVIHVIDTVLMPAQG